MKTGIAVLLIAAPCELFADDMSVLAYPVVFWPLGLLCVIIMLIFFFIAIRKLRIKNYSRGTAAFAGISLTVTLFVMIIFPLFISDTHAGVKFKNLFWTTVIPVEIVAVLTCVTLIFLFIQSIKNL